MTSSSFSSSVIPDILSFSSANSFYSSPFSAVRLLMKLLSHQSWDQSLRNYKNTLHSPSVPLCVQAAVISPLVSSFFAALASASHFRSALSLHPSHRLLLQLKYGEGSWFLSQTCVCSVLSGCSLDSSPSTHIADLVAWLPKSQVLFPITVLMFWECAKDLDCYQSFIWVAIKQHYPSLYVALDTSCCGLFSGPQWRHIHFIHLFRSYHQLAPCPPLLVWGKKKSFLFFHPPRLFLLQKIADQTDTKIFMWTEWRAGLCIFGQRFMSMPGRNCIIVLGELWCALASSGLLHITFSILNPLSGWTWWQIIAWMK